MKEFCSYKECKIMFTHDLDIKYGKYWVREKIKDKIVLRLAEKDDIDRGNFGLNDEDDLVPAYRINDVAKFFAKVIAEALQIENERKFSHFIEKVKEIFRGKR